MARDINKKDTININFIKPFSLQKKYGVEINRCVSNIPDSQFICIMDYDAMFLSHKQIEWVYEYVEKYPDTGLFLAMSNRSGSAHQKVDGIRSLDYSMFNWHHRVYQKQKTLEVTEIHDNLISGFLMLFSKNMWNEIKFSEEYDVLHVDRNFAQRILDSGRTIKIMNDIIVWHSYRLLTGTQNKNHLLNG